MKDYMDLPDYYNLVKRVAQIGSVLGCVFGAIGVFGGLNMFNYGFMAGMTAIFGGAVTVIVSLVTLGVTYCFLAIVKAQIDSRNAIVNYVTSKSVD